MTEKNKGTVKVTEREMVRNTLAETIKTAFGLEKIGRTKEGLVLNVNEKDVVVRVILKKEKVEKADILEFL